MMDTCKGCGSLIPLFRRGRRFCSGYCHRKYSTLNPWKPESQVVTALPKADPDTPQPRRLSEPLETLEQVDIHRKHLCRRTDKCLNTAKEWAGFSCLDCAVNDPISDSERVIRMSDLPHIWEGLLN